MPLRMTTLGCLALVLAGLVAGCGSEDAPPTLKEDFIAKVDRLCAADDRRTAQAAADFQDAIKDDDYAAAAAVVTGLQTTEAATIEQIEAIDPPEADQVTIDEYVSLSKQLNELDTRIADAVKLEDHEASDVAEKEGDLLEDRRNRLADDYGFNQCGTGEDAL
ncbi:MAG: hypothetical protein JJE13_09560 [Thermoleophilia bacterium]|nr:hypothetical protein [Thermoleophilia bacterium]